MSSFVHEGFHNNESDINWQLHGDPDKKQFIFVAKTGRFQEADEDFLVRISLSETNIKLLIKSIELNEHFLVASKDVTLEFFSAFKLSCLRGMSGLWITFTPNSAQLQYVLSMLKYTIGEK
jgi:hypothetical protein